MQHMKRRQDQAVGKTNRGTAGAPYPALLASDWGRVKACGVGLHDIMESRLTLELKNGDL